MTIYLDAIWLLNFLIDLMLLLLTQALARDSTRKIRIIVGAIVASAIVPISLYFPDSFLTSVIGKLFYSILIILCAFRLQSFYQTVKILLLFYFSTFAIGGGLLALHFLLQNPIGLSSSGVLTFNSGYGDPVSWLFIAIGFPAIWIFTKIRMDRHAAEKIRYDQLCPVTIQIGKKQCSTTGYIDSGNQLLDPLTKKPVIICDEPFLQQWFSEREWQMLKTASDTFSFDVLPKQWEKRVHIVPYQGVEGKRMLMLVIKADKLIMYYNKKKIMTNKILIGVQFSELAKDGSYHCLLHPQIIKLAAVYSA